MEAFLDYVSQFDKDFRKRIRGATHEEIAHLEKLYGSQLPDLYKRFLLAMGHSNRELALAYQGSTDIDQIIGYYKYAGTDEEYPPPPNSLIIGTGDISVGDICLLFKRQKEPSVFFCQEGELTHLYSESLQKLLYRCAFSAHKLKLFPVKKIFTGDPKDKLIQTAHEILSAMGFDLQWFSDEIAICAERPGAAVFIEKYEHTGIWINISAQNYENADQIGNTFTRRMEIHPFKQR